VPYFAKDRLNDYLRLAAQVRAAGIGVELYPEPRKLGQQLSYASDKGFRVALIAGDQELDHGECKVKNLEQRAEDTVSLKGGFDELIAAIRRILKDQ
jgi:histidyl-tRNA synthetase